MLWFVAHFNPPQVKPMYHRREAIATQAVLIPVAGHYDKKPRSLDREVTAIGRARGADLCLEANEISTLHCLIFRTAEGFRIRDCNSRCGTRINGESIKSALLRDADIVNIGPFSFEFHVPASLFPKEGARPDPAKIEHWKLSRARFAQIALKLRKRLTGKSPRETEWAQKAHLLKEKIRCYDQRLGDLEEAEKELADERTQLAKERDAHHGHVQKIETELATRLAQADEEIHQRWQEFQRRCQQAQTAAANGPAALERTPSVQSRPLEQDDEHQRERLRQLEEQLTRQEQQLLREQQEFTTMKDQWVQDQAKSAAAGEDRQAALAQQEAGLRAQKAELVRMMGDLKKMQEDLRQKARPDIKALHDEIERLAHENQELRGALEQQAPTDEFERRTEGLHAEVELLHEELNQKEALLRELQAGPGDADAASLLAENQLLKKLLEEKDRDVEEANKQSAPAPKTEGDLERYETELNEYRRQLEADRGKLNAELEMLRERNKELDEAVREMEMEMSKERAELARERTRLDRVRDEVKADMERMQREIAVRDSMAPVQKLRDELNGKAPAKTEKPLNDRLRSLRNQLTDSHPAS